MTQRYEVLSGAGLWERLDPMWRAALSRSGSTSPFLTAEWVEAWLGCFSERADVRALIWRGDGEEVLAAALLARGEKRWGPVPVGRVYLNAPGIDGVWCEQNDLLCEPAERAALLPGLVSMARELGGEELVLLGAKEELLRELRVAWPGRTVEGFASEAPYVALDDLRSSGTDYLDALSSNTRWQIRRSKRLYEEMYGVPSVTIAGTSAEALDFFDDLVALHEARWRARGETGAWGDPDVVRFHRALLAGACFGNEPARLGIELARISFGSTAVGYLYNLRFRQRVSQYQSGHHYEDDPRLKPGLVCHAMAVERCLERGDLEYDFMGGTPHALRHKTSLATDAHRRFWVELQAPSPKMRALTSLRRTRRRMLGRSEERGPNLADGL